MHPFVLVPLAISIAGTALAAAIAARDPSRLPNRLAAALMASTALWSVGEVGWTTARTAGDAVSWARWAALGSMPLAPLAFHLFATLQPALAPRVRGLVTLTYAVTAVCIGLCIATPGVVSGVVASSWGWQPQLGPSVPFVYAALVAFPLAGIARWLRLRRGVDAARLPRSPRIVIAAVSTFALSTLSDVVFPSLGIHFPHLGGASIAIWGVASWITVYRFRDPVRDARAFAGQILEILPEGVVLLRLDGNIRAANRLIGELAGVAPRELIGRPIGELLARTAQPPQTAAGERECDLVSLGGERLPVAVSDAPLRDDAGETIGYVLVVRDIREVASLRSRLVTSGRLAAVGQLAAGIAHEINNPIAFLRANASLLLRHLETLGDSLSKESGPAVSGALREGEEILRESCDGIDRVVAIVRDVSGFSRSTRARVEDADLAALLETALRVAAPQWRGRAAIERDYADAPLVPCVAQELMQVFLNLLLNAVQSMDERGTIRLSTRLAGGRVEVWVEDDGAGIAPELRDRIFEPFFTTKPVGLGTGLGLAISRQIVERHGGAIDVDAGPGRNTCFRVSLPLTRAAELG